MLILGFREVTTTGDHGLFDCPRCARMVDYRLRKVRNFFTLYWVPIIPLNFVREFIQCNECRHEFPSRVLEPEYVDPEYAARKSFQQAAINLVLLPMLLADGTVRDAEVSIVRAMAWELFGGTMDAAQLEQQILQVRNSRVDEMLHELKVVAHTFDEDQKELLLMSAWRVAAVDGNLIDEEWRMLASLGEAMSLTAYQMDAVIAQAESLGLEQ